MDFPMLKVSFAERQFEVRRGDTNAVAQGKVTLKDAQMWCGSWEPDNKALPLKNNSTVKRARLQDFLPIVPPENLTFQTAPIYTHTKEVWDASDNLAHRPKFSGTDGKIVGGSNASGGLDLAANWELLCGRAGGGAAAADACAGKQQLRQ